MRIFSDEKLSTCEYLYAVEISYADALANQL